MERAVRAEREPDRDLRPGVDCSNELGNSTKPEFWSCSSCCASRLVLAASWFLFSATSESKEAPR